VPDDVEVLYPLWHHNSGLDSKRLGMPSAYVNGSGKVPRGMGITSDWLWGWVIHPDLRLECTRAKRSAAEKKLREKYGTDFRHCYRPRDWNHRNASPVRIWTGRKWQWFWCLPNNSGQTRPAKSL